jgi:hypothetical protein
VRLSLEIRNAVSLRPGLSAGAALVGRMAWPTGPAGVAEHSESTRGFPRNVRELWCTHDPFPAEYREINSRPCLWFARPGSETANNSWYRRAKETECSERCSSSRINP